MASFAEPIHPAGLATRLLPHNRCRHHDIILVGPDHPERANAEALVQKVYQQAYKARISSFYPYLLAIRNSDGSLVAVAGVRPAGGDILFSEQYLDRPASDLLGISREKLVEVGNLAPAGLGQVRWIIAAVTAFLHGAGFSHVMFTAVPLLYNAFQRLGLQPEFLAEALPEKLPEGVREEWGDYYQCRPVVYSGSIEHGYQSLLGMADTESALNRIWRKAYFAGQYASYDLQEVV